MSAGSPIRWHLRRRARRINASIRHTSWRHSCRQLRHRRRREPSANGIGTGREIAYARGCSCRMSWGGRSPCCRSGSHGRHCVSCCRHRPPGGRPRASWSTPYPTCDGGRGGWSWHCLRVRALRRIGAC